MGLEEGGRCAPNRAVSGGGGRLGGAGRRAAASSPARGPGTRRDGQVGARPASLAPSAAGPGKPAGRRAGGRGPGAAPLVLSAPARGPHGAVAESEVWSGFGAGPGKCRARGDAVERAPRSWGPPPPKLARRAAGPARGGLPGCPDFLTSAPTCCPRLWKEALGEAWRCWSQCG